MVRVAENFASMVQEVLEDAEQGAMPHFGLCEARVSSIQASMHIRF